MESHINFIPLLLVVLLAFFVPFLLGRLRWLPVVVGEILAGLIIGNSGLNLIVESEILDIFSNIGLSFLMFLAGMEIDFDQLFPNQKSEVKTKDSKREPNKSPSALNQSFLTYLLTVLLALGSSFALNFLGFPINPWLLAFVLSATSLGVLLPILKQRQITQTKTGRAIFLNALLADFLTVVILTIFLIIHQKGLDFQILSIILLFLAFFLTHRLMDRFFTIPAVSKLIDELSQVTIQIKVRGAIATLMSFVVLASMLGLELILGAFLAGMIISLIRPAEEKELVQKLEAIGYGFFIPVFFIMVGINMDLAALIGNPTSLLAIPIILLFSILIKVIPMMVYRKQIGWRETIASGVLLNTHLSIEISIAVIGERLGLLNATTSTLLVLFALITVLVMPILYNYISPQSERQERKVIVIFKGNLMGLQVARIMRDHLEEVRFLDPDPENFDQIRKDGFDIFQNNLFNSCSKEKVNEKIKALLALDTDDNKNLKICQAARQCGVPHITSLVNDTSRLDEYRLLNINPFAPGLYQSALLSLLTRSPQLFNLLTDTTDDKDVIEIKVNNPIVENRRLLDLGLAGDLLILSINRDDETIIPHGRTRIQLGDRLTVLGSQYHLQELRDMIELQ